MLAETQILTHSHTVLNDSLERHYIESNYETRMRQPASQPECVTPLYISSAAVVL